MSRRLQLMVVGTFATLLFIGGCHRIDDPPLPQSPRGMEALGVNTYATRPLPAAPIVVERDPIVVTAEPDSPLVTAADVVRESAAVEGRIDLRYDATDEITIRGPVLGKRFIKLEGGHTVEIVKLMIGSEFIDVMLGTTELSFGHNIDVAVTDPIMVRGHVVRHQGSDLLLARELTWRGSTYTLRHAEGWPMWREGESRVAVRTPASRSSWWPW